MYVILLKYIRPLEEVDTLLAAHIEFLDTQYRKGTFIASGARIPRTGGVILAAGLDLATLNDILEQDPFSLAKVAEYEIIEFSPSKMAEGFKQFVIPKHPSI